MFRFLSIQPAQSGGAFLASPATDSPQEEASITDAALQHPNPKRSSCGREVRATLALTLFVLSQWVLPQAVLLQGAKGRTLGIASAQAAEPIAAQRSGKKSAVSGSAKVVTPPAWYRASRLKDTRREAQMQKHGRLLLAQNTEKREIPGATITRVKTGDDKAKAVSGPPLLEGVFPTELRPSAPLATPPEISHFFLDLANDRVPTQAEIVAQGSLAGPLSPVAPAEAEVYAAQVDQKLRQEGFEQGLNTEFPTPEQAQGLPNLVGAAKRFDEAKKLVKKARDQNREFARAMQKWNRNQFKESAEDFEAYFKKYPKSPWTPEAMIHVANYAKYSGQSNTSEDLYRKVIEMTSNDPAEPSYNAHRKAFRRLTDLYLIEGRYGEVRPMLEDLLYNDTNWSRRTWGLYWLTQINALTNDAKRLLAERDCGTQALAALLAQTDHPRQAREVKDLQPSDPRGFSLAQLRDISAQRGVPLVGFEATAAQLSGLPLPLLLHYGRKDGQDKAVAAPGKTASRFKLQRNLPNAAAFEHFVLVRSYDARRDAWSVLNPQDGSSANLTSAQLEQQWSGRGLMLASQPPKRAGKSPIPSFAAGKVINASFPVAPGNRSQGQLPASGGVKRLSLPQMQTTFGTGYAVKGQSNIGEDDANLYMVGSSGPSCGSPSVSINPISQNIYIKDTPVWYSPSKGPDIQITLSYNSLDASNYNRRVGGNKWSVNYASYVVELPGKATIYMPDGSQLNFVNPNYGQSETDTGTDLVMIPKMSSYDSPRGFFSSLTKNNVSGEFTLTTPEGDKTIYYGSPDYSYNPNNNYQFIGSLKQQTDRYGNSIYIGYDQIGNYSVPARIIDADGKQTILKYDNNARLVYVQTPDERQASFSYDYYGNMVQCVDVAGQAFQYSYDDMAIVTQLNTIQGSWDFALDKTASGTGFRNYKTTITNPERKSRVLAFSTDDPGYHNPGHYYSTDYRNNMTEYTTVPLAQSGYPDNFNNRVSSVRYPSGLVVSSSFADDRHFSPTSVAMPGLTTNTTYNNVGRVRQVVQQAASGASRTVDLAVGDNSIDVTQVVVSGKVSASATPISQTVYQASNFFYHQPQTVIDTAGHRTDFTYTAWGGPATVKTYEGAVTHTATYNYGTSAGTTGNESNRLIGMQYDGVAMASFLHDTSGRVKSATDVPTNTTTRYQYNNLDAPVATIYPDNTKELIDYTCCTLPGMVTDRSGKKTYYDYDVLKRLVRVQDAEGQTLQIDYDADGNRTGLLDAKGQKTSWTYDVAGRSVSKRYADGSSESVHAAVQGWVDASTNGRGQTTFYSYNDFGDLRLVDAPNPLYYIVDPVHSPDVQWHYDALGRPTSMIDGLGHTKWRYNSAGELDLEDGPWDNDKVFYDFDTLDRLQRLNVGRSATTTDTDNFTFGYDSLSRLSSIGASVGGASIGSFGLTYQGQSDKLERIDRPNGTQTQYVYEASGLKRLLGVQNRVTASGANQSSFVAQYRYVSLRDNLSDITRTYGGEAGQTMSYGYSATSMLRTELGHSSYVGTSDNPRLRNHYMFDAMGNRQQAKSEITRTQVDFHSNALNQLTDHVNYDISGSAPVKTSMTSYGYDGDGNQTSTLTQNSSGSSQTSYGYDDRSRLVSVTAPGSSRQEFVYDGLDRLRVSLVYTWQNRAWSAPVEKRRVYDENLFHFLWHRHFFDVNPPDLMG